MRGATDSLGVKCKLLRISIHAPHARSDDIQTFNGNHGTFQSTLLMRGATGILSDTVDALRISIHAPHARSDCINHNSHANALISIHAPHARSNPTRTALVLFPRLFQSTLLMRGATKGRHVGDKVIYIISIHAPHARSDTVTRLSDLSCIISIHAPHARSDCKRQYVPYQDDISIHAPHARSDAHAAMTTTKSANFNPRSSCEERPPNW